MYDLKKQKDKLIKFYSESDGHNEQWKNTTYGNHKNILSVEEYSETMY